MEEGNSCFINPENFEPYPNQWQFLNEIDEFRQKFQTNYIKKFSYLSKSPNSQKQQWEIDDFASTKYKCSERYGLTTPLINFLKEELNFANSEYFIKKKSGKNTFGTEKYFKLVEETENQIIIPRGFIGKLLRFCIEQNLEFDFQDNRKLKDEISYSFNATLRNHQEKIVETVSKKDFGVIVAPPSSGKTVMGLKIISEKNNLH